MSASLIAQTPAASPAASTDRASRLAYLSYLRVLAIVAVVTIHVSGLTIGMTGLRGSGTWWVATALNNASTWSVPVFVMISGALLLEPARDEGAIDFYRRRLDRIGIPLLFWHLFYVGFRFTQGENLTVEKLAKNLLQAHVYTALYFFWLILGLYLITPILRGFIAHARQRDVAFMTGVVTAGCLLYEPVHYFMGYMGWAEPPSLNVMTYFMPYVGFYLLGYVLRDTVLSRGRLVAAVLACAAIFAETTWQYAHVRDYPLLTALLPVNTLGLLPATSAVLVFLIVRTLVPPTSRLARPPHAKRWRYLGDITLGVFVTHLVVLEALMLVPGLEGGASNLPELAFLLAGTVAGAFVASAVLKRIPLVNRTV